MAKKGYKVFDENWCCRGFQYEVGKTYTHEGEIKLCTAGFHFCENLIDCFDYYPFNKETHVAEIIARGDIITDGQKSVTNIIDIVRELDWSEVLKIVNFGIDNNGCGNTGDRNTGDYNTGYCNTGYFNTGNYNTGYCNTGMWNHTSYSSGYFNTCGSPLIVFNQPVNMTRKEFLTLLGVRLIRGLYKDNYKVFVTKNAQKWYDALSPQNKQAIKDIPNFDAKIFKQITGIDVEYSN